MTRDILQTQTEREVIKQAPDCVVYINGANYLVNKFLDVDGVTVPFNDFFTSFQAGYGVDDFVPTGSITLAVPHALDYLFRSPGGNNLLQTMSEIRVFMKGYYLSSRGNSMYYQVFRGYLSAVNYVPDGKMTMITLQCRGIMGLLEKMQLDLNPALMNSAMMDVTPMSSNQFNMNPYQMMAFIFQYMWVVDGFTSASIPQLKMDTNNPYFSGVQDSVGIWNARLLDIARDVHIFGTSRPVAEAKAKTKKAIGHGDTAKSSASQQTMMVGTVSAAQDAIDNAGYYESIRQFLPEMSFGSIQLLNGRVVNRLERLNQIVNMVGFEGHQDIDGAIVIKPPLYNMDVTQVGSTDPLHDPPVSASMPGAAVLQNYDVNNPFVIELAEILTESESEDESAVRLTRMIAHGRLDPGWDLAGTEQFLSMAEEIDISKLKQFGLRTEPPHSAGWVKEGDMKGLYGFVVSELARANKGFRTYTVTIPVRPELKLGFPIYFPHKDIYAYPKTVSINYVQGSEATMTIALDSIRRRPLFPAEQTIPATAATPAQKVMMLTPSPNLVLKWCKPTQNSGSVKPIKEQGALMAQAGTLASATTPVGDVYQQQLDIYAYRKNKMGAGFGVNPDTTTHSWMIQPDGKNSKGQDAPKVFDHFRELVSVPKGTETIYNDYFEALRTVRPYTDQKGYELIGPFPWGRWKSIKGTVYQFTIRNPVPIPGMPAAPVPSTQVPLATANAFLFTGSAQPSASTGAVDDIQKTLAARSSVIESTKVFELTYDDTGLSSTPTGTQSLVGASVDVIADATTVIADEYQRAQSFLTGAPVASNTIQDILRSNDAKAEFQSNTTLLPANVPAASGPTWAGVASAFKAISVNPPTPGGNS